MAYGYHLAVRFQADATVEMLISLFYCSIARNKRDHVRHTIQPSQNKETSKITQRTTWYAVIDAEKKALTTTNSQQPKRDRILHSAQRVRYGNITCYGVHGFATVATQIVYTHATRISDSDCHCISLVYAVFTKDLNIQTSFRWMEHIFVTATQTLYRLDECVHVWVRMTSL